MTEPAQQRERILDEAVRLLAVNGESGLTVRAVAAASDCSTTGIYTWFGGKDGLLEAIYIGGFNSFREYVGQDDRTWPDTAQGARSRVRAATQHYWQWALQNPTRYLFMFAGAKGRFSPSAEARAEATAGFDDLVQRVSALLGPGSSLEEAAESAHLLWATLHGHVMLHLAGPGTDVETAGRRYARAVQTLVDALTAKEPIPRDTSGGL